MKIHWNMKERSHADSEAWAVRLRQTSEIYGNLTSDIFGQKVDSNMWGLVCYKRQCDACLLFCWNWHLFLPFLAFAFCRVELIPEHLLGPRPRKWAGATAWYGHSDMHGQRIYKNKNTSSAQPCRGGSLKTKRWCIRNHWPTGDVCEMSKQWKWWLRGASMNEQWNGMKLTHEWLTEWIKLNYIMTWNDVKSYEWVNNEMTWQMKWHEIAWMYEMRWDEMRWMNERKGWMNECMNEWMIQWMKELKLNWIEFKWTEMKWMNGWNEWMNEQMNKWNEWNEWMNL